MTEPKWATWSCNKCEVKVALRANSKGDAKHWCKRQSGKYLPLTKEVPSDTKDPNGGGGPAGSSPGSDARTERSAQPSGDIDPERLLDEHLANVFKPPYQCPKHTTSRSVVINCPDCISHLANAGYVSAFRRSCGGVGAYLYRDALARAGGFGSYAGFLAFCGWVCGD